jgi:ribose transport system substrate-binding protein
MKKTLSLVLIVLMAIAVNSAFAAGRKDAAGSGTVFMGTAIRSLENPYHAVWARGGQAFSDSVGGTHVIQTCEGSSEKQLNDILALVAKSGKDAVFCIDPNESPNIIPIARALEAAGIYYVSWWNKPDEVKVTDYPHWVAHIAFDGISAGEFGAEALIKSMGGKGNIVAIKGMLSNSVAIDRFTGLENVLKKYPDVKLLTADTAEWDRTKAFEKMKSFLAAYPQIDGVWAANDNMALGALEALRAAGLAGKVLVTGCDGITEMLDAVAAGEAAATVLNDSFWQGGIGLSLAYAAKTGQIDVSKIPADKRAYFARAVEVDRSNVQEIIATFVKGTPKYDWTDLYANYVRPMK